MPATGKAGLVVTEELRDTVKVRAAQSGIKMERYVTDALERYMAEEHGSATKAKVDGGLPASKVISDVIERLKAELLSAVDSAGRALAASDHAKVQEEAGKATAGQNHHAAEAEKLLEPESQYRGLIRDLRKRKGGGGGGHPKRGSG